MTDSAWAIIRHSAEALLGEDWSKSVDPEDAEVIRLASLNHALSSFMKCSNKTLANSKQIPFSKPAFSSTFIGLKENVVLEKTRNLLNSIPGYEHKYQVDSAPILLSAIHSICSYSISPVGRLFQKNFGAFYTPAPLAKYIVNSTLCIEAKTRTTKSNPEDYSQEIPRILDPACGTGSFLIAAFQHLCHSFPRKKSYAWSTGRSDEVNQLICNNLYGVDLDLGSLEVTDVSLSLLMGETRIPLSSQLGVTLKQGNSLISLKVDEDGKSLGTFFQEPNQHVPFEWYEEFPEVFSTSSSQSGFDVVLANPPYERLKPNRIEHERRSDNQLFHRFPQLAFEHEKERLRERIAYFRNSGTYHYSNVYSIDTYRLFIERSLQLLKKGGSFSFIVPSTLAGDLASKKIRKHLFANNDLLKLDFFTEDSELFEQVSQAFCIITGKKGSKTSKFEIRFGLQSIDQLYEKPRYEMSKDEVERVVGSSLVIPRIESFEWKILQRIHEYEPVRKLEWLLNHRGELDLTLDKEYILSSGNGPPLLTGSDIGRYALQKNPSRRKRRVVNLDEFVQSKKGSVRMKHIELDRIACQQVNNQNQKWRLKFARVPSGSVLANSCNYFTVDIEDTSVHILDYLLGVMNSELMNWRFSSTSYNNHVSNRELDLLPVPNPFDSKQPIGIIKRIAEVTGTINQPITGLVSEIEGLVFRLYGLDESMASHMMKKRGLPSQHIREILAYM